MTAPDAPDVRGTHPPLATGPGVSRFDLPCGPQAPDDAVELVGRWARDRALPAPAMDRLCRLTSAALAHGTRLHPRSVTVRLRWADPDRVLLDVQWHGARQVHPIAGSKADEIARVMDAAADSWGFESGATPDHWMVLDTSRPGARGDDPRT